MVAGLMTGAAAKDKLKAMDNGLTYKTSSWGRSFRILKLFDSL